MKGSSVRTWLVLAAACAASGSVWAQLGKPTAEELARRGNGPGPSVVPAGSNGPPGSEIDQRGAVPKADPRDFSGYWRMASGPAGGSARQGGGPPSAPGGSAPRLGGPAPGAPPGPPPAPGGDPSPAGNAATVAGRLPDRILCLPQPGTQVGIDGPLLLTQTPGQITWAAEEMHTIRRIFLTGGYTPGFTPNYYGEALGHWDGNTLVVETVGIKSLPPGAKMVERWTKSADGRTLEMKIGTVDAAGRALGGERTQRLTYRVGEQLLEWMCEDYNDEWLPGGADYDDQVGKK